MKSIVQELQAGATDKNQRASDLLRKAKIVATKLNLPEFLHWIDNELNGYKNPEEIPPYRMMKGEPKGWNPYHGWVPLVFEDSDIYEKISAIPTNQSMEGMEEIIERGSKNLQIPYGPEAQVTLGNYVGFQTWFGLMVDRSAVAGVLDAIRNIILDWSLKLEKEGILGEGLSFSQHEQEKANEPRTIVKIGKIENFIGSLGTVADQVSMSITQINEKSISQIKDLTNQIKKHINDVGFSRTNKTAVENSIQELDDELIRDNPEPSQISKLLGSVRRIMEGASGNIIAQGIIASIDKLI